MTKQEMLQDQSWMGPLNPITLNRERLVCKNGVSLSLQASRKHYCSPKNNVGPYELVEVGFIEGCEKPQSFQPYVMALSEGEIFDHIPLEIVVDFILENGGLKD